MSAGLVEGRPSESRIPPVGDRRPHVGRHPDSGLRGGAERDVEHQRAVSVRAGNRVRRRLVADRVAAAARRGHDRRRVRHGNADQSRVGTHPGVVTRRPPMIAVADKHHRHTQIGCTGLFDGQRCRHVAGMHPHRGIGVDDGGCPSVAYHPRVCVRLDRARPGHLYVRRDEPDAVSVNTAGVGANQHVSRDVGYIGGEASGLVCLDHPFLEFPGVHHEGLGLGQLGHYPSPRFEAVPLRRSLVRCQRCLNTTESVTYSHCSRTVRNRPMRG